MKVHVWHTGSVYIDQALAFREKSFHPIPYSGWLRGKWKKRWVPVSSYLIEHPKGKILIDTGWHEEIRTNQKKHLGRFAHSMFQGQLNKGSSILEQLNNFGLESKDIDFVLLTHLHSDHVSGLKHVKEAKKIITSELEWKAANKKIGYIKSMWDGVPIETFEMSEIPFGPFRKGLDLFGDGTLFLVHTPGHSDGMFSILVKMNNGWLLLASDVGYSQKSWEEIILPGVTTNKVFAKKSLEWIKEFSKRKDCIKVIANHDTEIEPQIVL
ncbi:N-acyl homoserine lactonase family protein [Rossellomorea vietnamensis]|uniref:N-acyl homoserine lactonase family protein n=1 Tax=Rossellomorea vietnamensis TaxID=218284 RepID=A0A5D4M9C9_9BACI|nr:N-acyl homoserine lactonase family protein [Rossellomorea vietnamensis]TYR98554.1 N-acyl homoserine lactonase family protein [Rossellomorea vietnamensis]